MRRNFPEVETLVDKATQILNNLKDHIVKTRRLRLPYSYYFCENKPAAPSAVFNKKMSKGTERPDVINKTFLECSEQDRDRNLRGGAAQQ